MIPIYILHKHSLDDNVFPLLEIQQLELKLLLGFINDNHMVLFGEGSRWQGYTDVYKYNAKKLIEFEE